MEEKKEVPNESKTIKTETKQLEAEPNELLETNKYLEESLELMQTEFESMEDYWEKKIGEERTFYEERLAVSENQFKELELRLKEYREMLNNMEASKLNGEDKLFAIEEQP